MKFRGIKFVSPHNIHKGRPNPLYGVTIPQVFAAELEIDTETQLAVTTDGESITYTPVPQKSKQGRGIHATGRKKGFDTIGEHIRSAPFDHGKDRWTMEA